MLILKHKEKEKPTTSLKRRGLHSNRLHGYVREAKSLKEGLPQDPLQPRLGPRGPSQPHTSDKELCRRVHCFTERPHTIQAIPGQQDKRGGGGRREREQGVQVLGFIR